MLLNLVRFPYNDSPLFPEFAKAEQGLEAPIAESRMAEIQCGDPCG